MDENYLFDNLNGIGSFVLLVSGQSSFLQIKLELGGHGRGVGISSTSDGYLVIPTL